MRMVIEFDQAGNIGVTTDADIPEPWLFQVGLKLCSRAFMAVLAHAERAAGGELAQPRVVPVTIMPRTLG